MYQTKLLDNKIKLITKEIPSSESVTVLCLVGAGSRYEDSSNRGISHFLEHMFFKGGQKFKNAKEVATKIDSIGGDFNAFTGKEYAGYYVKCAVEHIDTACAVLSDMLITAKFDQQEIEKERGVILEELNMYQDTPMYQVSWNFENFILGNQPLGWDTIGKKEVILNLQQKDFQTYKKSLYTPENIVISVAGGLEHQQVVDKISQYFNQMKGEKTRSFQKLKPYTAPEKTHIFEKNTEQGHFVIGGKGPEAKHPDAFAFKVLSVLCGGMMSSRMFLNVREAKGLCYYISTSTDDFMDVGLISTRAGVDLKRINEAVESILNEYQNLKEIPVTKKELEKSKNYLQGKMKLRLEDSEEVAHMLGKQALLYDEILSIKEIEDKINQVTIKDLHRLAKQVFSLKNLYISMIGPFTKNKKEIDQLMQ